MTSRQTFLVFQSNEMTAMLVYQTKAVGVQLFFSWKHSFVAINLHGCWTREAAGHAQYLRRNIVISNKGKEKADGPRALVN